MQKVAGVLSGDAAAGRQPSALTQQQETTMKNVMCIVAIVMSLVGSANFAMAQSFQDQGVVTGSEANRAAHYNNGEYTEW
jgi:hypothetical protein